MAPSKQLENSAPNPPNFSARPTVPTPRQIDIITNAVTQEVHVIMVSNNAGDQLALGRGGRQRLASRS